MNGWLTLALPLSLVILPGPASAAGGLRPVGLRCEHLADPLGIDAPRPRLGWKLEADGRGRAQTAYQILAAGTAAALGADRGELWDSGRVASGETVGIVYQGEPAGSGRGVLWKVRVWDEAGVASPWSAAASWEAGLLAAGDWQAGWIGRNTDIEDRSAPLFRREFVLEAKPRRARVHISGLGYHELRINGRKVGDHLLDPGYTRYDRRVLYVTHDVTGMLAAGPNVLGVMLGNGWFNVQYRNAWDFDKAPWRAAPRLLCSLHVEYDDGRRLVVGSGPDWQCAAGPVTFNVIYGGETHDARLEQPGWDQPGFAAAGWQAAQPVDPPAGRLAPQVMPPIKAHEVLAPARISEPKPGVFVFDFGQNLAGFAELAVAGPAGTVVRMKYGERLLPDGSVDQREIAEHVVRFDAGQQFQTDTYILRGGGAERWHARFVYHGFQYVEVSGLPERPTDATLRAVFIHSAVPDVGRFECSEPLLNRIWRATRWAYLSNLHGIPTDCPHREKNGWTGDAHLACETGLLNFDGIAVYEKWLRDLADEQRPGGELPGIVPTGGWGYQWGNGPAWDSAFVLIPACLHDYCGDPTALRVHYDGLRRYVDYLTSRAKDGIVDIGLNDWAPYETETPAEVTSTGYYHRDALVVARAAELAGRPDDAARYAALAGRIRDAFNRRFYQPEAGSYANGGQTALACALYQDLVAPAERGRVVASLAAAVERRGGHIDTGILGAKYLLHALSDNGRHDLAWRVATQRDQPGWGWWIGQGATTLWEQWNGSASRNHIMFGDIGAWFVQSLAGIRPDPAGPGFRRIIICPRPVAGLGAARAEHDSARGRIASDWRLRDGVFELAVVIPPNTTATVHVPAAGEAPVSEGGGPAAEAEGVKFLRRDGERAVFQVGSGSYRFAVPAAGGG